MPVASSGRQSNQTISLMLAGSIAIPLATLIKDDTISLLEFKFKSLNRYKKDENILDLGCQRYRGFRQLQQKIMDLALILEKTSDIVLRESILPAKLYHGYRKLPNEIIIRIAEKLPPYDLVCLSHVNQRFRQVLCSTSNLWTTVDTFENFDMVRTQLERSSQSPLDATLDFIKLTKKKDDPRSSLPTFNLLFAQRERWRSITFEANARHSDFDFHAFPMQDLQSVKTLTLPGFEDHLSEDFDIDLELDASERFHRSWTWPASNSLCSLTTLILREDIPSSQTTSDVCFPHLSDLRFIFEAPELADELRLNAFITGHNALETLSFSVNCEGPSSILQYQSRLPKIKLPSLEKLRGSVRLPNIRCKEDDDHFHHSSASFCNLLQGISAASIETFELEWSQGFNFLEDIIPALPDVEDLLHYEEMASLKSIRISAEQSDVDNWRCMMELEPFLVELHKVIPSVDKITCLLPPKIFEMSMHIPSIVGAEVTRPSYLSCMVLQEAVEQLVEREPKGVAEMHLEKYVVDRIRARLGGVDFKVSISDTVVATGR